MAELPGWDRDRLRTASDGDVAAARWQVYVRQFKSFLSRDLKREIDDLRVADSGDHKLQERHEHKRRLEAIEELKAAATLQAALRTRLGLEALSDA